MNDVMTPEEFKVKMFEASNAYYNFPEFKLNQVHDTEESHRSMDDLMCKVLRSLGYGEGIDIFKKTKKWYA